MDIQFKNPAMENKELIKSYMKQVNYKSCELTFSNLLLWAPFYETKFAVVDDMLVFISGEKNSSFFFPIGSGDIQKTILSLMEYCREKGKEFKMNGVTEEMFDILSSLFPNTFEIEYNRDYADYIYLTEKMITLSGKKYHGKKNHINKFVSTYDWAYEEIDDSNARECCRMIMKWAEQADEAGSAITKGNDGKAEEINVALRALSLRKELGLLGGLIRVDGKIVACTLGEAINDETFVIHIEKAFSDIQGAYTIINQQFLEHTVKNFKYVNREEDMGIEGLRKAKLSYKPEILLEKGFVKAL